MHQLAAQYRRSPDQPSEDEEVRSYLLGLRQRGVACGTFQTSHDGIRLFYQHTLGRAWELFGEKRIASPRQKRLPDALSGELFRHLLNAICNPCHKTCLAVMYACGLRISEATALKSVPSTGPTRCCASSARACHGGGRGRQGAAGAASPRRAGRLVADPSPAPLAIP